MNNDKTASASILDSLTKKPTVKQETVTTNETVKTNKKKSVLNLHLSEDMKQYLRIMSWYRRNNGMSDTIIKLIEKDMKENQAVYQEAERSYNNENQE